MPAVSLYSPELTSREVTLSVTLTTSHKSVLYTGKPEIGSYRWRSVNSLTLQFCHFSGPTGPPPPILASMAPCTISSVTSAHMVTVPRFVMMLTRSPLFIPRVSASMVLIVTVGSGLSFESPEIP